ncbi:hypothetical protein LCGC14_0469090 [marine sediment metagenome]|uniref:Uncharacterized protein n=1 Tax=marine sediment metagenome TaxID=412755 RepID=A0A0F9SCP3_9ZZZZ
MADRTPGAVSSVAAPQQTQDTATHFAAIESAPAYRLVFETIEREILDGRLALGDVADNMARRDRHFRAECGCHPRL